MSHLVHRVRCTCIAAAVLAGTVAACGSREAAPGSFPEAGAPGTVTAGEAASLVQAAEGRVLVLNLWATWCPPCVAEMPELAAFHGEHPRKDVVLLALSLDAPDEVDTKVKSFVQAKEIPFPVRVLAERDLDAISKAVKSDLAGVLPTTLIYDRKGRLVRMWEGAITREELNGIVKPLL